MGVKAQNQVTILDITDSYSVILSNENQTFVETGYDAGAARITSSTTVRAYRGSEEMWVWLANPVEATDSQDNTLKLTINKSATKTTKGLQLSITTNKAGWKQSGSLTLPILIFDREVTSSPSTSSEGYLVTIGKEFSYSIAKYGDTGAAPTVYELQPSVTQITVNGEGTITPSSVRVSAIQQTGDSNYIDYEGAGIQVLGHPATGSDAPIGSSTASTPYVDFTPTTNYIYYIATLTVGNKVVDKQTIGISKDGQDGEDAYAIDITSSNGLVFKNSGISTTLTAHVYKGGTELTGYNSTYGFGTSTNPGPFINWYSGETAVATGTTYQISDDNVNSIITIIAKLEDTKATIASSSN